MTIFVLQNNRRKVAEMTARLARALRQSGRELFDFSVIDEIPARLFEETSGPRFLYGSSEMVQLAYADSRLQRDLFFEPGQFDQRTWVEHRQAELLNGVGSNITWNELRALTARESVFVRPTFDQKSFAGALIGPESAKEWFSVAEERNSRLTGGSQVWVSRPKRIFSEYRFVVLDHELITGSRYRANDVLAVTSDVPAEVAAGAARLARGWLPARLVTMDVAVVEGNALQIVEFNSIHSSGLYLTDLFKVIDAIERAYSAVC
jgi:hypothetical protein